MIFHLGFELPERTSEVLAHDSPDLTRGEVKILKDQIRKNSILIDETIGRLDLLVNKERYPPRAVFIEKIRLRLNVLMEENDTFRAVLWRHIRRQNLAEK